MSRETEYDEVIEYIRTTILTNEDCLYIIELMTENIQSNINRVRDKAK